jgi:DNA replication ATP-dependent helicase Dna2
MSYIAVKLIPMLQEALAGLFYVELKKAVLSDSIAPEDRLYRLKKIFHLLINEATREERIQFSTLFARLAYIGHRYQFSEELMYYLHLFRHQLSVNTKNKAFSLSETYDLGARALALTIQGLSQLEIPNELFQALPASWPVPFVPSSHPVTYSKLRVTALADDTHSKRLLVTAEEFPGQHRLVQYDIIDRNVLFNNSIEIIQRILGFPVTLNLLNVEIDDEGILRPEAFIIEPDFLIDISTLAASFKEQQARPWLFLMDKFKSSGVTKYILLGNIANHFLDELMSNPEAAFDQIFPSVFAKYPLSFCTLPEEDMRDIFHKSKLHFLHLKQAVHGVFLEQGIHPEHCYLEPSFYADQYGIQGRLDVFCYNPGNKSEAAIVELKSGKIFNTNAHGINNEHFIQTLLYDLLIESVFDNQVEPACYILYSSIPDNNLRFAPRVRANQLEALMVRNQLVAIEWKLQQLSAAGTEDLAEQGRALFGRLNTRAFPHIKGFIRNDLLAFENMISGLSDIALRYITAFAGFIAREHRLAKMGAIGFNNINGLASLWLNDEEEKRENFQFLGQLTITSNKARDKDPILTLARPEGTDELANFRSGDIAVLYPARQAGTGVLGNQIFKCTIVELSATAVVVKLRSQQFNEAIFSQFSHWNIEPDTLDTSFAGMYRSLSAFANSDPVKRKLILGLNMPAYSPPLQLEKAAELTGEQHDILCKALAATDYFLLWGPPGTGKTSVLLKHMVIRLLDNPAENILLLAYTNRAVDEMCESVEAIGSDMRSQYLRIGGRYSAGAAYQGQLLDKLIDDMKHRSELLALIQQRRIVLSTVSSLSAKAELLSLKDFTTVIIDEASQILEPNLVGLLPRFRRFILIGDHKQLPAVVQQDDKHSSVHDAALQDIGLYNLRNSLFERLFHRCVRMGLIHAFARLSHQGRMHQDIMDFPNRFFYQGGLQILPEGTPGAIIQRAPLRAKPVLDIPLSAMLSSKRVVFMDAATDDAGATLKTNRHEAALIADLVHAFSHMYKGAGLSTGIITPFRAQIAMIKAELDKRQLNAEGITIDTVERYQGGACDIILISLCVNSVFSLESVVSLSDEGVDRKLNVALTRAREHVVVVGNKELLSQNELYNAFITQYES